MIGNGFGGINPAVGNQNEIDHFPEFTLFPDFISVDQIVRNNRLIQI
jgi:hypothetical protein